MQCPCGYEAAEEAKYCQECGKKLRVAGDPLQELPWDAMPAKFTVEDLARFMGVSEQVIWTLTCKHRFPHSSRTNFIKKDKLREWFISTGWIYKPKPSPKPPAPPPAETVAKIDWTQKPAILTPKEMLEIFGCSKYTLSVFTHTIWGIPHVKIGGGIRYRTEDVIKWAKQFKDPMAINFLKRSDGRGRK